jgi:adenosylmethionine-8-amino-7-oxononanoate aminotransferase
MLTNSLAEYDRLHWVHPVSAWQDHAKKGPLIFDRAEGIYLYDVNGKQYLDGFAGLWCVNVGYGQNSIVEAVRAQMEKLPYATGYFGYASEPAIRLAQKLAEITPGDLNHVYFTLGGSDAIDGAVRFKIMRQVSEP